MPSSLRVAQSPVMTCWAPSMTLKVRPSSRVPCSSRTPRSGWPAGRLAGVGRQRTVVEAEQQGVGRRREAGRGSRRGRPARRHLGIAAALAGAEPVDQHGVGEPGQAVLDLGAPHGAGRVHRAQRRHVRHRAPRLGGLQRPQDRAGEGVADDGQTGQPLALDHGQELVGVEGSLLEQHQRAAGVQRGHGADPHAGAVHQRAAGIETIGPAARHSSTNRGTSSTEVGASMPGRATEMAR